MPKSLSPSQGNFKYNQVRMYCVLFKKQILIARDEMEEMWCRDKCDRCGEANIQFDGSDAYMRIALKDGTKNLSFENTEAICNVCYKREAMALGKPQLRAVRKPRGYREESGGRRY